MARFVGCLLSGQVDFAHTCGHKSCCLVCRNPPEQMETDVPRAALASQETRVCDKSSLSQTQDLLAATRS